MNHSVTTFKVSGYTLYFDKDDVVIMNGKLGLPLDSEELIYCRNGNTT